ncbi:Short chain dehydrogenase atnD [Colletotrichum sp. SAR11_59]|nr:Short chain dehydrogenase atnD [Colletotrichum sp. SAR11_59]
MPSVIEFLQSQLFTEVPVATKKINGQTIIVTGSNTGLGLETARHFILLDAAKVILAVRKKDDSLITVNAVSPFLLSMLLLPKMRETSLKYAKETVITFVGSLGHARVDFIESKSENIFKDLAVEKTARMTERYNISKVIQLQLARELAENVTKSEKPSEFITSDEGIKVQKQLWKELLEKLAAIAPGIVDSL